MELGLGLIGVGGGGRWKVDCGVFSPQVKRLAGTTMANPKHVEIVKQGAKAIEEWRAERLLDQPPDLREADLHGVDLSWSIPFHADMDGGNLRGADSS